MRSRDGVKGERVSLERGEGEERFAVALAWAPPINLRLQDPGQPLGGPPPEDEVERRREQQRPSVRQDGGVPATAEHETCCVSSIPLDHRISRVALREPVPSCETRRVCLHDLAILTAGVRPGPLEHGLLGEQQGAIGIPEPRDQVRRATGDHGPIARPVWG